MKETEAMVPPAGLRSPAWSAAARHFQTSTALSMTKHDDKKKRVAALLAQAILRIVDQAEALHNPDPNDQAQQPQGPGHDKRKSDRSGAPLG